MRLTKHDDADAAMAKVKAAGVKAPDEAIRRWVNAVGPKSVLQSSDREIRRVANAF